MRPAQLRGRRQLTLRPAQFQYSPVDEASLLTPLIRRHAVSMSVNALVVLPGLKQTWVPLARLLLRLDIRPSRDLRKGRHVVADQLVESFRRGRLRLQADRGPALPRAGVGEDAHDFTVEFRHDWSRNGR